METASKHSQKDFLIIFRSLLTTDPRYFYTKKPQKSTISETTLKMRNLNIKCNILSLCGELSVLNDIALSNNGILEVPRDEEHFRRILIVFFSGSTHKQKFSCGTQTIKNSAKVNGPSKLIEVGFPKWELIGDSKITEKSETGQKPITKVKNIRSFCACHQLITYFFIKYKFLDALGIVVQDAMLFIVKFLVIVKYADYY